MPPPSLAEISQAVRKGAHKAFLELQERRKKNKKMSSTIKDALLDPQVHYLLGTTLTIKQLVQLEGAGEYKKIRLFKEPIFQKALEQTPDLLNKVLVLPEADIPAFQQSLKEAIPPSTPVAAFDPPAVTSAPTTPRSTHEEEAAAHVSMEPASEPPSEVALAELANEIVDGQSEEDKTLIALTQSQVISVTDSAEVVARATELDQKKLCYTDGKPIGPRVQRYIALDLLTEKQATALTMKERRVLENPDISRLIFQTHEKKIDLESDKGFNHRFTLTVAQALDPSFTAGKQSSLTEEAKKRQTAGRLLKAEFSVDQKFDAVSSIRSSLSLSAKKASEDPSETRRPTHD
ncbi:MAG: hypothetical protein HY939_07645 [Gammaproteobacteria bacterium]|nr:hypothetical protein [Gammaproteobacteria bacterium]